MRRYVDKGKRGAPAPHGEIIGETCAFDNVYISL